MGNKRTRKKLPSEIERLIRFRIDLRQKMTRVDEESERYQQLQQKYNEATRKYNYKKDAYDHKYN